MSNITFPIALWEGFEAVHTEQNQQTLIIHLKPIDNGHCACGKPAKAVHDASLRSVSERTIMAFQVQLRLPVRRILCPDCGIVREHISWLKPYARQTTLLIEHVEALLKLLPIKHISQLLGLHWHTIKTIDKRRLAREVTEPDWSRVKRLVMDEFALFKGHRYATVVADADTHQVLWIGEGRSREAIRPFFVKLGQYCQQIEAVAMDMNTAFDLEVQKHCPQAKVVYDLFHVVAKYGREVIDRVRVDQANQLKHDKPARKRVKRGRWVLLKNRDNLTDKQAGYLNELLESNKSLMTVYLLREQLKEMWYCTDEAEATAQWNLWWQQVRESCIRPLLQFGQRLKNYLHGIVASAVHPLHTCRLEGMNNKIKLLKRMGYGYRDTEYFFLKVREAFPGDPR
ncbi:ISL3 family transposase [Shewanella algae]|uniref:Transposase and inactivated derivatives n=15 Tax=Shewanella algae TaxID=38313 RepID=A0A380AA68_9GAMM|nr:ISL3 family transposase [Shewanella algae]AXQ13888.1 ISL3 family transposase [Shewanella algae]QXP20344.1 ISL3 family transposase [Shewanella algae]QXP30003.1 ISL3 family transposase [Shewanella algae]QXP33011.1 ISL3 family transposase [Shewanella algae]QXP39160.1 ISL3 family transposase [Shewanella algae]